MTIAAIVAMILAGLFIFWVLDRLTMPEIQTKAQEKLSLPGARKWVLVSLRHIAKDPSVNEISLKELSRLADEEGVTCAAVLLDENGNLIGDVEVTKEKNPSSSADIQKLLNGQVLTVEN